MMKMQATTDDGKVFVDANELDSLRAEVEDYRNGYKGSCFCCEPVALKNQELRAEVASLKEKESAYYRLLEVEGSDVMVDTLNRIDDLTQQLAAANGRVEMLRGTIAEVCEGYTLHDGARKQLETALWAALSNLNEDSAG